MTVRAIDSAVTGMQKATEKLNEAAQSISKFGTTKDDSDLAVDIVELKIAKHTYAANATVIKTVQETDEALLDILV